MGINKGNKPKRIAYDKFLKEVHEPQSHNAWTESVCVIFALVAFRAERNDK